MTAGVNWLRKIQALLYPYPPDATFDPSTRIERSQVYLESAAVKAHDLSSVIDAHDIAFALDIPSFIKKSQPENLFQANPCIIHPLSGETEHLSLKPPDNLQQQMSSAMERFADLAGDQRKQFLALWVF